MRRAFEQGIPPLVEEGLGDELEPGGEGHVWCKKERKNERQEKHQAGEVRRTERGKDQWRVSQVRAQVYFKDSCVEIRGDDVNLASRNSLLSANIASSSSFDTQQVSETSLGLASYGTSAVVKRM